MSDLLLNDFGGKAVLVSGGTEGIGLAIGLAFGAEGAQVCLTHQPGAVAADQLETLFAKKGAPAPMLIAADPAKDKDTVALLEQIKTSHDEVEVFVGNVGVSPGGGGFDEYERRSFLEGLEQDAWPFIGYVQKIKEVFGRYPRYTLGASFDSPDTYYPDQDLVAASRAVIETFCRYMAKHIFEEEGACINILRTRPVLGESLTTRFGEQFEPFLKRFGGDDYLIEPEAVGEAALALCSGLLDAMTGQVVSLDKGVGFADNLMRLYEHRAEYGLLDH